MVSLQLCCRAPLSSPKNKESIPSSVACNLQDPKRMVIMVGHCPLFLVTRHCPLDSQHLNLTRVPCVFCIDSFPSFFYLKIITFFKS